MAALTSQRSGIAGATVAEVADATKSALQSRTWAIDEEVIELVKLDSERRGVRYYSNRGSNVARTYNVLRKRLAAGGDGTVTKPQLVRDLYPGIDTPEDAERVESSVRRWLRLLERVGLVHCEALTVGAGKWVGLRYELLDVAEAGARMGAARGCSSVGYSVSSHTARRRRLTAKEREAQRVRSWCPRAGRGALPSFVEPDHPRAAPPPARAFFSPERFAPSRGQEDPPTGVPPGQSEQTRTREGAVGPSSRSAPGGGGLRGAAGWEGVRDAIERACPPSGRAALARLRQEGTEQGTSGLRRAGLADDVGGAALALAAWATCLPDLEPRCSIDTAAQLDRSFAQLCRFWERADVVDLVVGQIERCSPDGFDQLDGSQLHTIKVIALVVKRWARQARRHALGKPAPRPHRPRGDGSL